MDLLTAAADKAPKTPPAWDPNAGGAAVDFTHLGRETQLWYEGNKVASTKDGRTDRSLTLFTLGRLLSKTGLDGPSIVRALADRDEALGYKKYSQRKDGGIQAYTGIAQKVLAPGPVYPRASQGAAAALSDEDWEQWASDLADTDEKMLPSYGNIFPGDTEPAPLSVAAIEKRWHKNAMEIRRDYLERLVTAMREGGDGEEADRLEKCCLKFFRFKCASSGDHFIKPDSCHRPGCLNCAGRRFFRFFKTKEKYLVTLEHLKVYEINTGTVSLPPPDMAAERQEAVAGRITEAGAMLVNLKNELGEKWATARDNFIGLRFQNRGDKFTVLIVLAAEKEVGAYPMLKAFFESQKCPTVAIRDFRVTSVEHMVNLFIDLMVTSIDWDIYANYKRIVAVMKGRRLIQGRGAFYKVVGGKEAGADKKLKTPKCPICGTCVPEEEGHHHYKDYRIEMHVSPVTELAYYDAVPKRGADGGGAAG